MAQGECALPQEALMSQMTHSEFHIEPAREDDWPWIARRQVEIAWLRLEPERQQRLGRQAVEASVARQVERLRHDPGFPSRAFVARADDGTPAGFIWVAKDQNDSTGQMEASLLNQYVDEVYRGQGLGRRLMETAEEWARQQGLSHISLSVGAGNRLGQRLYQSLGYTVETLRMTKKLGPQKDDEDVRLTND
jgi:ribosomal protein S18 acetylase RimI-like enzyme